MDIYLNICLCKVDKTYTVCSLKTMELLDCGLIGICVVIRLNTSMTGTAPDKGCIHIMLYCFLFLHKNICCDYSLEIKVPQRGTSNEYPQCMCSWRNKKNISTIQLKKKCLTRSSVYFRQFLSFFFSPLSTINLK